tara:strand:+ start:788 stop:1474 length:687 start_codon:yes stop_codon:yes gene_type:complete
MMLQSIGKGRFYLYIAFLIILLSIHNINFNEKINNTFKIKKIILMGEIENDLKEEISIALNQFNNTNIFLINPKDVEIVLNDYNLISKYKIKKEFPSVLKIELKKTNILAYFFENNKKIYLGENGKKIENLYLVNNDLPLIVGNLDIENFLDLKKKLLQNGFKINDFSKFYSFKSKRWDLVHKKKITIKLPIENLDYTLTLLREIIDRSNIDKIEIIDLRINKRIILS